MLLLCTERRCAAFSSRCPTGRAHFADEHTTMNITMDGPETELRSAFQECNSINGGWQTSRTVHQLDHYPRNLQISFEVFSFFSLCISEGKEFRMILGSQIACLATRRASLCDGLADPRTPVFPSGVPADEQGEQLPMHSL